MVGNRIPETQKVEIRYFLIYNPGIWMGGIKKMTLNIHDRTPASETPMWLKSMLIGMFLLMYSFFALMAFVVISYSGHVVGGLTVALLPILFLLWFLWDQKNLSKAHIDISDEGIIVTEYPLGRKSVKRIEYAQIHHAKLIRPYSIKLRGPRTMDLGIPYVVFYNQSEEQLFKLLAYPEALKFQQSVTQLR